jgi:hypothetical protein
VSDDVGDDPELEPQPQPHPQAQLEPRPDTTAAGNALLYLWGSLLAFGVFLVAVPGREAAGRTWLWVGLVVGALAAVGFTRAVRARLAYLRRDG